MLKMLLLLLLLLKREFAVLASTMITVRCEHMRGTRTPDVHTGSEGSRVTCDTVCVQAAPHPLHAA